MSKAFDAWRRWVADQRNRPIYETGFGDVACALCGAIVDLDGKTGHEPDCPYLLMTKELGR